MTVSTELAAFAEGLRLADIPERTRSKAMDCLIDYCRLALVGAQTPWSRRLHDAAVRQGGAGEAATPYYGTRLPVQQAAFLAGTFAHGLEWDDIHLPSITHPGAVVFPAVLAVGEQVRATGSDMLVAAVLGYEVMTRIGLTVQLSHYADLGFHGTATLGVFGAAAAAARLMGMAAPDIEHALAIASSHSAGLAEFHASGGSVKRIHAGKAARDGIEAARLVAAGVTGVPNFMSARQGYCQAYSRTPDPARAVDRLGTRWLIDEVAIKTHACGRGLQASIDAVAEIAHREGLAAEDVVEIVLHASPVHAGLFTYVPNDMMGAQLSIPFSIALLLHRGRPDVPLQFADYVRDWNSEAVIAIARRCRVEIDPASLAAIAAKRYPSTVRAELVTTDGRRFDNTVIHPLGDPENPIPPDALRDRLRQQVEGIVPGDQAERLIGLVDGLDSLKNGADLADSLCVRPGPRP